VVTRKAPRQSLRQSTILSEYAREYARIHSSRTSICSEQSPRAEEHCATLEAYIAMAATFVFRHGTFAARVVRLE